jgi:hypothetical protein
VGRCTRWLARGTFAFVVAAVPAGAADWFVSPTGADTNAGTSPAAAFRTIQRGADAAGPGDTVHLGAGTYGDAVVLRHSGAPGSPITITSDGSAVVLDAQQRDCPAGKGIASGAPFGAIQMAHQHDVVIDGIEVTGWCIDGVVVQFTDDVVLRNLHVHHNGVTLRNHEGNGIAVQAGANLLVEHCDVSDNASRNKFSGSGIAVFQTDQVIVRDNVTDRNAGNGILIEDVTNAVVERNTARYNIGDVRSWGTGGIWVDGGHTITVRNNWFEGNIWAGLEITDETPSDPWAYEIYDNVAVGNWYALWLDGIGQASQPANLIYGNTFVDNTVAGIRIVGRSTSGVAHTRIYNNVVAQLGVDRPALQVDAGVFDDVLVDDNLLYRQGSTTPVNWGFVYRGAYDTTPTSTADVTFTDYQVLSGWDASSLSVDPSFVNAAAGDYHLAAGSPAIDAGSPLYVASTDYDGHPRPAGAGPDVGAFEGSGPCAACALTPAPVQTFDSTARPPTKPLRLTIPPSATSVTKVVKVRPMNGDVSPRDLFGHRIQVAVTDGDCPPGTVVGVPAYHFQRLRGPESSDVIAGGRSLPVRVQLALARADFASIDHCALQMTVTTPLPGAVDPVPGNDTIAVPLEIVAP